MAILLAVIIAGTFAIGSLFGLVLFHWVETPVDQRRLNLLADRLQAEMDLANLTREAMTGLRDVARTAAGRQNQR